MNDPISSFVSHPGIHQRIGAAKRVQAWASKDVPGLEQVASSSKWQSLSRLRPKTELFPRRGLLGTSKLRRKIWTIVILEQSAEFKRNFQCLPECKKWRRKWRGFHQFKKFTDKCIFLAREHKSVWWMFHLSLRIEPYLTTVWFFSNDTKGSNSTRRRKKIIQIWKKILVVL